MSIHYLDNSALARLWESGVDRKFVSDRLILKRSLLLIGPPSIAEMSAALVTRHEIELLERISFIESCPTKMPLSIGPCIDAEFRGRPIFETEDCLRLSLSAVCDLAHVVRMRQALNGDKLRWKELVVSSRQDIPFDEPGQERRDMHTWFPELPQLVDDWCHQMMSKNISTWGLENRLPDPRKVPTFWAIASYLISSEVLDLSIGRKADGNDLLDMHHYVTAAHSDVFVTEDKHLRRVVDLCPPPKPTVMGAMEWVHSL